MYKRQAQTRTRDAQSTGLNSAPPETFPAVHQSQGITLNTEAPLAKRPRHQTNQAWLPVQGQHEGIGSTELNVWKILHSAPLDAQLLASVRGES